MMTKNTTEQNPKRAKIIGIPVEKIIKSLPIKRQIHIQTMADKYIREYKASQEIDL